MSFFLKECFANLSDKVDHGSGMDAQRVVASINANPALIFPLKWGVCVSPADIQITFLKTFISFSP